MCTKPKIDTDICKKMTYCGFCKPCCIKQPRKFDQTKQSTASAFGEQSKNVFKNMQGFAKKDVKLFQFTLKVKKHVKICGMCKRYDITSCYPQYDEKIFCECFQRQNYENSMQNYAELCGILWTA